MANREQNLEKIGAVYATFKVHQTGNNDDLTDADVGGAVTITGNYEVGNGLDGDVLLGRLIDLSLTDADAGRRVATVQVGGVMTLSGVAVMPSVGDRVVINGAGAVKQAPALTGNDPAGGNVARGTVIEVSGGKVTLIM